MKRMIVLGVMLVLGGAVYAQKEIDLSGTVKDGKGITVAGVIVTLVSDSLLKDTTDANGTFSITNQTVISSGAVGGKVMNKIGIFGIKGNNLRFSIEMPVDNGTLSLFSANGKKSVEIQIGKMESGMQSVMLPELVPGLYIMDLSVGQSVTRLKMVATGSGFFMSNEIAELYGASVILRAAAAVQSVDTLIANKNGFKTVKMALESYKQSGIAIVTDSVSISSNKGNLFATVLGKTEEEIDAKLDKAFQQLFYGTGEQPIYYDGSIRDIANGDVRSEGQSYGMMICVQYDKPEEFQKIWSWTKSHMGVTNFHWQRDFYGNSKGSGSDGSAPDGEEYFAMSLILAGRRWKNDSYIQEGARVCGATKQFFNGNLCQFVAGSGFIDVSYVLPAFYEVFAEVDAPNSGFWKTCASTGRNFFHKVCHPQTMLTPKCATTGGQPTDETNFESDSWRVVANIMTDWYHYGVDQWQKDTYAPTYAKFWKEIQPKVPMPSKMSTDGTRIVDANESRAKGIIAYNALVGFALPPEDSKFFVQELWDCEIPSGHYRYYDGCIYLMALAHASGRFQLKF